MALERGRWKRYLASLVVVLFVVGAFIVWRGYSRFKGPPPPVCSQAPLTRKAFDPPRQLSTASSPGARVYDIEPAGALLPDGTLALAWNSRGYVFSGSGLTTARVPVDGGFQAHALEVKRRQVFDAWMTTADDGALHLVWLAHNGGSPERDMEVQHATSRDGETWASLPAAHASEDCPDASLGCLDKPMVAPVDGGVVVFYYSSPGEGLRATVPAARTSVKVAGGAYADVFRSSSGGLHVVAVDDLDDAGVSEAEAEDELGTSAVGVRYARSTDDGTSWTTSFANDRAEEIPFFFSNPQVVADDARGLVYVAYPAGPESGVWSIRLATSSDQGQTWSRITVNDDPPCASHMTPHLALDPLTGTVFVTWLENRSGKGGLAFAACASGGRSCGPNEAVSTPFASYSYERHLPAWLSEYGLLEFDAKRRVLHAVWTQPVDEQGSAVSRIFHAQAHWPE